MSNDIESQPKKTSKLKLVIYGSALALILAAGGSEIYRGIQSGEGINMERFDKLLDRLITMMESSD